MIPRRVRTDRGVVCRVLEELEDGRLLLDTPDGPRAYAGRRLREVGAIVAPRAVGGPVSPDERAAYELSVRGVPRAQIAARFRITPHTLKSWLDKVDAADADARNLAKLRGTR